MEVQLYRIDNSELHCSFDLKMEEKNLENHSILEISAAEILLKSSVKRVPGQYIDLNLSFPGLPPLKKLACIRSLKNNTLKLQWIHFDRQEIEDFIAFLKNILPESSVIGKSLIKLPKAPSKPTSEEVPLPEPSPEILDPHLENILSKLVDLDQTDKTSLKHLRTLLPKLLETKNLVSPSNENNDILEHQVKRLAHSLEDAEITISRLKKELQRSGSLENIPSLFSHGRSSQEQREAKKTLLKALFEENISFRAQRKI
jgi:hypothetical protein